MSLFDGATCQADRIAHVAKMLGYSPNHPDSWPLATINNILSICERKAECELNHQILRMGKRK